MLNTDVMRQAVQQTLGDLPVTARLMHDAADEIDTLRLIVSRLNQRCEAVAKVTDDPEVYDLLNDAAFKVEQEIREEAHDG